MSKPAFLLATLISACLLLLTLIATTQLTARRGVELTYWEEQTSLPSTQQRWLQWMSHNDAGPPVGALGHGWDGMDRTGMFPGDGPVIVPRFAAQPMPVANAARTMSLDELDHTLRRGSDSYVSAHKYLEQLRQQSIAGQKAYVAKKQAEARKAMKEGMKQAKALYQYTEKHGYGRDLTKQYWANLKALSKTAIGHK